MNDKEKLVLEYTELVKEFANMPKNGGYTPVEADGIVKRKAEIKLKLNEIKRKIGGLEVYRFRTH